MQRALALMTQEDLSSQEAFRSFIGRVEALYGLELFAVVDEDNVVYTEHTTYMGGSRYAFLSDELSRIRTITTNATYGGGKDICLSLPVQNRVFNGKKLKTCFIEINMDDIVSMLAFNTQEKGTYFSLYYENGENLTGLDFGPVGAKQNLLTFMSRYLTAAEAEALSGNFRNGTAGKVLFSFSGAGQMFYYSPIPETGWMITVLIPENLIYDQIGGIREETMTRSTIQILITCANEKADMKLTRITYDYDLERKPVHYQAEEWITDKYCVNKKHTKLLPISGKFRRKTIDRKDFIFNKFNTLLNEK